MSSYFDDQKITDELDKSWIFLLTSLEFSPSLEEILKLIF